MKMILASASPRRRELLRQIGWEFEICVSDKEEKAADDIPRHVVEALSRQKAEDVLLRIGEDTWRPADDRKGSAAGTGEVIQSDTEEAILVIGADTIVSLEGRIMGKPRDGEDAERMLRMLQGRSHLVYTGVTLLLKKPGSSVVSRTFHEETRVDFYPMTEEEIAEYVAGGEPMDKAGAYGIQGECARYIRGIAGDYNNVVGLPVGRLYQETRALLKGL